MSPVDAEPILELDELLDSRRLAAAWQVARERALAAVVAAEQAAAAVASPLDPAAAAGAAGGTAAGAGAAGAAPATPPPLPVAVAHRQLLDELERVLASLPAKARLVLADAPARLAVAISADKLDAGAAEAVLDELEDLLQALLGAARWPASGEE